MARLNVVFTGGGTGGHVYPAIAIAQALGDTANVTFIGTADRLEAKIVPQAGYPLITVRSAPLKRAYINVVGLFQAMRALARLQPDILIATGGYVCFPVVLAARSLRSIGVIHSKIVLLEPNAQPGLTNRILGPTVDELWSAFTQVDKRLANKCVRTGIPVRGSLRNLPLRNDALERLGLSTQRSTLLAIGGSQGARSINDALTSLLLTNGLPEGWQLIHVTGEREYDRIRAVLQQAQHDTSQPNTCHSEPVEGSLRPYLNDMTDAYAAADLVLARAGASTVGELAATGRPAILVPYPYAAGDHQRANAEMVARTGAAVVVDDRELIAGKLRGVLADVTKPARLAELRAAAERERALDPLKIVLGRVDALTMRKNQK